MAPVRVAIITNVIPNYRLGFYQRILDRSDVKVTVFCQDRIPGLNLRTVQEEIAAHCVCLPSWIIRKEKFAWQWLPVRRLWKNFDVFVFYGNPRVVSTVLWATVFRALGRIVVIWGQAHSAGANTWLERLRLQWWKLFKFLFVYTDAEAEKLKRVAFRNTVIVGMNNGLNQCEIDKIAQGWTQPRLYRWRCENSISDNEVVLSCARLEEKNRFDLFVRSMDHILRKHPNLIWVVIGGGEQRNKLERLAVSLGVEQHVRWLGPIYDEQQLAPWFLSSKLCIHPGAIGLSLLHAFGYGLPVITHDNARHQMPEYAALVPDRNGATFKERSVISLARVANELLTDDAKRENLSRGALRTVRQQYNIDVMASRFFLLVDQTLLDQETAR